MCGKVLPPHGHKKVAIASDILPEFCLNFALLSGNHKHSPSPTIDLPLCLIIQRGFTWPKPAIST